MFGLKSTRQEAEKIKEEQEDTNIYCVPSIFQVLSGGFWAHSYILCSCYGLHLAVEETETWRDYDLSKVTDIVRGSAVIWLPHPDPASSISSGVTAFLS